MKSSYIDKIKTSFPIEERFRKYGIYAASDITFENVNIEATKKQFKSSYDIIKKFFDTPGNKLLNERRI